MLGRRHDYHVSPFASTPHRSSPGYAHSPPSPWSYEGFRKPENEKSYTIKINANFLSKCHGREPVGIYFRHLYQCWVWAYSRQRRFGGWHGEWQGTCCCG